MKISMTEQEKGEVLIENVQVTAWAVLTVQPFDEVNTIQLMTLDEVNTTIYQPQRSDNQISGVDKSWF